MMKAIQAVENYFQVNFKEVVEIVNTEYKFTKAQILDMVNELAVENGAKKLNTYDLKMVFKEYGIKLVNHKAEPTNPVKKAQKWAKAHGYEKATNIECYVAYVLEEVLKIEGVVNEAKFELPKKVNKKEIVNPDFMVGKKIIEVQGDYWHGNPNKYKELNDIQKKGVENDKLKKEAYEANGYEVLYVWEMEILEAPEEVNEKLKNFFK